MSGSSIHGDCNPISYQYWIKIRINLVNEIQQVYETRVIKNIVPLCEKLVNIIKLLM
jgi:hypothetical protein